MQFFSICFLSAKLLLVWYLAIIVQLRDNIAHDNDKIECLKVQIKDHERDLEVVESKIAHAESTLKDLQKLQLQIATNTTRRNTLFELQEKQYIALSEENEG